MTTSLKRITLFKDNILKQRADLPLESTDAMYTPSMLITILFLIISLLAVIGLL